MARSRLTSSRQSGDLGGLRQPPGRTCRAPL